MTEKKPQAARSRRIIYMLLVASLILFAALSSISHRQREKEAEQEVEALRRKLTMLNGKLKALRNENSKLTSASDAKNNDLSRLQSSYQSTYQSLLRDYNEQQSLILELQSRILMSKAEREKYNVQLRAFWPAIEKKAPGFISKYREAYPNIGPDAFISVEYSPEHPKEGEKPYRGGSVQNFDGYDWLFKDCVWSPDHTKCIWTCIEDCDVDSNDVKFFDFNAKLDYSLMMCGTSCYFSDLAWLDDNTFMFVDYDLSYDPKWQRRVPVIYIYKTSPNLILSCIGSHRGPPIDRDKFPWHK